MARSLYNDHGALSFGTLWEHVLLAAYCHDEHCVLTLKKGRCIFSCVRTMGASQWRRTRPGAGIFSQILTISTPIFSLLPSQRVQSLLNWSWAICYRFNFTALWSKQNTHAQSKTSCSRRLISVISPKPGFFTVEVGVYQVLCIPLWPPCNFKSLAFNFNL